MEKLTRPLRTESKSNFTYIYHNFVPHFLSINEKNKVKWLQNFETIDCSEMKDNFLLIKQ